MIKTTLVNMNKWDSLVFLREHGLNTPNSTLFIPTLSHTETLFKLRKTLKEQSSSEDKVSIRTFKLSSECSFKEAFFPNVTVDFSLISRLMSLLEEKSFLIISSPIDPQDCLFRGCIQYQGKNFFGRSQFLIEYLEGPGTVRDLEYAKGKEIKQIEIGFHPGDWTPLKEVLGLTGLLLSGNADKIASALIGEGYSQFILEWSIYKKFVGIRKEKLIFWHLR